MIARLTGLLVQLGEGRMLLDRDGVGYEVLIPHYAMGELSACRGREVTLHTLQFLEGTATTGPLVPRLVGFPYPEDREFYRLFVDVRGLGPRKALRAMTIPPRQMASWIEAGDVRSLARLPGVGPRTAEHIVATLRGKLEAFALAGAAVPPEQAIEWTEAQRAALEVLVQWGDSRADVERWLQRAAQLHPQADTPDEWVRLAYRIKTGVER